MNVRRIFVGSACAVLALSMLFCAVACDGEDAVGTTEASESTSSAETTEAMTEINYDGIKASEYIKHILYKDMTVYLKNESDSKEKAFWDSIHVEMLKYPEEKVDYYFEQTKASYMYIVNNNEEDYLLLLKNRGTDEQKMRENAQRMVVEDLAYRYIIEKEDIVLTDEEKEQNFDKYVEKFAYEFRKPDAYIIAELSDHVYEAMLYDKTMEWLLANNTFEVVPDTAETSGENQK